MPELSGPNEPGLDEPAMTSLFPAKSSPGRWSVTSAALRGGHDGADHPGQRARPHPAEHVRPGGPDLAARRARRGGWPCSRTERIAAVGVTGKPFIFAAGADLTGAALIGSRDEALAVGRLGHDGLPAARRTRRAVVRVRQRRGPRRRPRTRAALLVPDDLLRRHRGRVPRVLPRPGARLGRHLPAAAPDRPGPGAEGHRREPAQPEPHAARAGGPRARHRRRHVRARRLPGRIAPLGGPDPDRRGHRDPGRRRTATGTQAVGMARFFTDGKLHGAAPAPYRAIELVAAARDRDPRRGVRRRGRGARGPAAQRRAAGRAVRLRPDPEAGAARGGRPGPVPGPPGDQGRRGGRGPDGRADRPAVRAAAGGAGGPDRPGPGPAGRRRGPRARRDRQAGRPRPDQRGRGQQADRAGHRVADQGRVRGRRLRDRGGLRETWRSSSGCSPRSRRWSGRTACWPPTPPPCR